MWYSIHLSFDYGQDIWTEALAANDDSQRVMMLMVLVMAKTLGNDVR